MYALSRLMLILTVVACCFGLVVVAVMSGGLGLIAIPVAILAFAARRVPQMFTAHGTARWATLRDLEYAGMVGASAGRSSAECGAKRKPRC